MKIICPICGKILPRYESVLIHIKRIHIEISPEKALEMAFNAKAIGFRRKNSKRIDSTINRERNVLLGEKVTYKKNKPHSIFWGSVIKTPNGSK